VFQSFNLFAHKTILENVMLAPMKVRKKSKTDAKAKALELLERVGIANQADKFPAQLSGGQQQRVGVARALAADPPVMLMDEPFSAVDPVVREQLQEEFLRLQGELGKTIVFVTHDIDEAIKLGDQVAVMRVGGHLAQLATPAALLNRPVDAFVAGFVGRDRGYRALGFTSAGVLATHDEQTVKLGSAIPGAADADADGWLLAVDDKGEPQGWLKTSDSHAAGAVVTDEILHRGGTLAQQGGSLRSALDAALSSPTGRGVVVDDDGRLVGSVTASEVLALIERREARRVPQPASSAASEAVPELVPEAMPDGAPRDSAQASDRASEQERRS
jgi:osmoprotectant transport system ATP-binding protein